MSEMAILSTLVVMILLKHLQNVTPEPTHIKLNLELTEIRAGMSAMSDEEGAGSNNESIHDLDGDDLRDISLV